MGGVNQGNSRVEGCVLKEEIGNKLSNLRLAQGNINVKEKNNLAWVKTFDYIDRVSKQFWRFAYRNELVEKPE